MAETSFRIIAKRPDGSFDAEYYVDGKYIGTYQYFNWNQFIASGAKYSIPMSANKEVLTQHPEVAASGISLDNRPTFQDAPTKQAGSSSQSIISGISGFMIVGAVILVGIVYFILKR